jgi:hypothetical protein
MPRIRGSVGADDQQLDAPLRGQCLTQASRPLAPLYEGAAYPRSDADGGESDAGCAARRPLGARVLGARVP